MKDKKIILTYANIGGIINIRTNGKELFWMSVKSTVVIQKEENWYVATALESGVASQGKTIDEALANLREASELYFGDYEPSGDSGTAA